MQLADVINLARQGESQTVEFKKSTAEKDRACRTLCAFANGQGGQLLFGITPSGKVVGQQVTDRTLEELAQEFQGFEPALTPGLKRLHLANSLEVISLDVPKANNVPITFRGVPYERVLNTTRAMPRVNYQRLLVESLNATDRWELQPAEGWTLDMLDATEITQTIEEAIRRGRSDEPGTRDPMAILRGLNLLTTDGRLNRAAAALFCKADSPRAEFPQFKLRVARFKGTTRSEFLDNRQYQGNAFDLMRRAERFLIDWLPVAGRIIPGKMEREDTPALPVEAVREALANAFVHRDYANFSGSIGVALYDDRLEIISPGGLHFGLTPEMLQQPHESMPWNPTIAGVYYRRGHIETWGRGTNKIAELLRQAGRAPVIVTSDVHSVNVTFRLPPRDGGVNGGVNGGVSGGVNQSATSPGAQTPDDVLRYIVAHPGVRAQTIANALGLAVRTVERRLRNLRESSLVEFMGPPKTGGYHAKQDSAE
jgi:ATP-dependent DNA helicase RecG